MNYILVVLFEITAEDSPSIQSIVHYGQSISDTALADYTLVIWDNSPEPLSDSVLFVKKQLPDFSVQYMNTSENRSLSSIYNEMAGRLRAGEYLTIFDHDTVIPGEYFEELRYAQKKKERLILPRVICQNKLVSPGKRFYCKGRLLSSIKSGRVVSKNLLAINSGMSIHASVFEKISYDERLRFYGTDTYFMKQYEKYFSFAYVLDVELQHSLAEMEKKPSEWYVENKKEKFRTFKIIFSGNFRERLFVKIYVFLDKLKTKCLRGY